MQARNDQRLASSTGLNTSKPMNGNVYGYTTTGQVQYNFPGQVYAQPATNTNSPHESMDTLAQAFGNIGIHGVGSVGAGRVINNTMSANPGGMGAVSTVQPNGQVLLQLPNGTLLMPGLNTSQSSYQQGVGAYSVTPTQPQYPQHANYLMSQAMPNTPQGQAWVPTQQFVRDLPDLAAPRRSSWSSNEETGPDTPFFGAYNQTYHPNVAISDQSPHPWSTPSPQHIGQAYLPQQLAKAPNGQYTYLDLDALCAKAPAIPKPVPAIFSKDKGQGSLESSLKNELNTTNVYVRGLHPDTTDEMLHSYGERFGEIVSAKSMLDQQTDLCKGFGFIKYHNFVDGENCIRGFFHLGYEAKWARESQNARLKTLGDPSNTNLYVSNLPISMNEAELGAIFEGVPILSKKILRDNNGVSRGVGFARFETPATCDKIIENFNGKPIGEEGSTLQIRYADTKDQKELKAKTAERRQFKTNEYNTVVYGPTSPYQFQTPTSATFPSPLQSRFPGTNGIWGHQVSVSPTIADYSRITTCFPNQAMPPMSGFKPSPENIAPARSRYSSRIAIESPSVAASAKHAAAVKVTLEDDGPICKAEPASPTVETNSSPSKSFS